MAHLCLVDRHCGFVLLLHHHQKLIASRKVSKAAFVPNEVCFALCWYPIKESVAITLPSSTVFIIVLQSFLQKDQNQKADYPSDLLD